MAPGHRELEVDDQFVKKCLNQSPSSTVLDLTAEEGAAQTLQTFSEKSVTPACCGENSEEGVLSSLAYATHEAEASITLHGSQISRESKPVFLQLIESPTGE